MSFINAAAVMAVVCVVFVLMGRVASALSSRTFDDIFGDMPPM